MLLTYTYFNPLEINLLNEKLHYILGVWVKKNWTNKRVSDNS